MASKSKAKSSVKSRATSKAASTRNVEITPNTKLRFAHARDSGGRKTKFLELVPKKGSITVSKLQKLGTSELKVPASRSIKWIPRFVQRGFVNIAAP